jgi:NAD(P)-dependent dehydrogenase (short-subunit alcohol dehydrogenase family)
MQDVAGKVAFISGGANGIGFGMAQAFVAADMKVAIADIDSDAAHRATARLGKRAVAVPLDVTQPEAWEAAASKVEAALGPVHVLCNNAGVTSAESVLHDTPLEGIPTDEWKWLMGINVTGQFYGLKTFLPRFKATQDLTHIVNTASMAGIVPQSRAIPAAYTISKYAIVGLTEQLRLELEGFPRIGLSMLCCGLVKTQIQSHSLKRAPHISELEKAKSADNPFLDALSSAMSPENIGKRVLKGIRDNDFYIFTHPEYKPLVQIYHSEMEASFGASAELGYTDPLPTWLPLKR